MRSAIGMAAANRRPADDGNFIDAAPLGTGARQYEGRNQNPLP
ncbi:MAG: hypothetical protein WDN31_13640 [Hyphomicrobium sp.]